MYFKRIPVPDKMGETFTVQDFDCLAHNIHRMVKARVEPQPLRVVELGTWSGQSTLAIAQPHVLVHAISSWDTGNDEQKSQWLTVFLDDEGNDSALGNIPFQQFVRNMEGVVFRTVMPIVWHPLDAADWWPERLDAVVVTGETGEWVLRDAVKAWGRHVRSGGYIFGVYKPHTVAALTGLGTYTIDGSIWRYRVQGGGKRAMGA